MTGALSERWGLDGRVLLFPLCVPPVILALILLADVWGRGGIPLTEAAFETIAFMLVLAMFSGLMAMGIGLPFWAAAWALARRGGVGRHGSGVIAAGTAGLAGSAGMHLLLLWKYGIGVQTLVSALTLGGLVAVVSMLLAAAIYRPRRRDAARGME